MQRMSKERVHKIMSHVHSKVYGKPRVPCQFFLLHEIITPENYKFFREVDLWIKLHIKFVWSTGMKFGMNLSTKEKML